MKRLATFGAAEAARRLGVSERTLLRWIAKGLVRDVRRGPRRRREFTARDIKRIRRETTARKRAAPKFLAVDFFCGAGGTTRGLIDAGGYVIAGIDKDERCKRTYVANNRNRSLDRAYPQFIDKDIFRKSKAAPAGQQSELRRELKTLIDTAKAAAPTAPLLFAICAPCQPFTSVSKKAMSRKRVAARWRDKNLLAEAAKFVSRFKPDIVLSENVPGINDPKFGGVWLAFRERLRRLGYVTATDVVCTSQFGIPQYRKRSILVAVRRERMPKTGKRLRLRVDNADPRAKAMTVKMAIGHYPRVAAGTAHASVKNHRTRGLSPLNKKRLAAAKPGESNAYLHDTDHGDLSLKCHRRVNRRLRTRCFSDVYTRMDPNAPSPTITTKCHSVTNGRFGHYDRRQVRGISLREAATLQSFKSNYTFFPDHQVEPVARMIGNAVPPRLAKYFATYLVNAIRPTRGEGRRAA